MVLPYIIIRYVREIFLAHYFFIPLTDARCRFLPPWENYLHNTKA